MKMKFQIAVTVCVLAIIHVTTSRVVTTAAVTENNRQYSLTTNITDSFRDETHESDSEFIITQLTASSQTTEIPMSCRVFATDEQISQRIKRDLSDSVKLVFLNLSIEEANVTFENNYTGPIYKMFSWVKISGRQGAKLLLLLGEFDLLPNRILSFELETMKVALKETPEFCFRELNASEAETLLRESVLNNFQNLSAEQSARLQPGREVCNIHINEDGSNADFRYMCCEKNSFGDLVCHFLYNDTWLTYLKYVAIVIACVVLLYSPHLFFKLILASKLPNLIIGEYRPDVVKCKVPVVKTKKESQKHKAVRFSQIKRKEMDDLCKTIRKLDDDRKYSLPFKGICLSVQTKHFICPCSAPFGLSRYLFNTFPRCGFCTPQREHGFFYEMCSKIGKTSAYGCLFSFALIGMWYALSATYDSNEVDMRNNAATVRGLKMKKDFLSPETFGYLWVILINSIIPISLSIFVIYLLGHFGYFMYLNTLSTLLGVVELTSIRDNTKRALQSIFCCSGEASCCGAFVSFFHFILMSPLLLVNMTVHLVIQTVKVVLHTSNCCTPDYEELGDSRFKRFSFSIAFMFQISTFLELGYSFLVMLWLSVHFLLKVMIYSLVGIILNASFTQLYIVLAVSLLIYAYDCFGHVAKRYQAYSEVILKALMDLAVENKDQIDQPVSQNNKNLNAFLVHGHINHKVKYSFQTFPGREIPLQMCLKGTFLFIDKQGVPYIPKSLFFSACEMPFNGAPGKLGKSYWKALQEFALILLFISFVFLVVLALGDSDSISSSNQLFATVAGTVLPKLFQQVLRNKQLPSKYDTNDIHFKTCLLNVIKALETKWTVSDIIINNESLETVNASASNLSAEHSEAELEDMKPSLNIQRHSRSNEYTPLLGDNEGEEIGSDFSKSDIVIYDDSMSPDESLNAAINFLSQQLESLA